MLRSSHLLRFSTFAVGFVILGLAASATAQTNWTGLIDSDWNDPGNCLLHR